MIGRTNTGGGGVGGLNFQVIGGTTSPNNPKENTIWVNTSTKITGWAFSATQPTGATGMVWISVGASSTVEFNALKKNNITVYPISAKQYVSGAWVDKTAKSYQNGAWVDWVRFVFKDGGYGDISGFICTRSTATLNNKILTLTSSGNVYSNAYSKEKIDLSNVDSIVVKFESGSIAYTGYFGVMATVPDQNTSTGVISGLDVVKTVAPGGGDMTSFSGDYALDVSNLSGEFYLVFNFSGTGKGNGILNISEITYG